MAVYLITASGSSQRTSAITTDKVRIVTTTAIYYATGNSSVTASSSNELVPANTIQTRFVGVGNYFAVIQDSVNGNVTITEVGTASSGTAQGNP
jgi:hypothetical protein